jgi:phosphohistidine phosphatase SixA
MPRLVLALLLLLGGAPATLAAPDPLLERLRAGGAVLLLRHATAPGTGDPPGFRRDDCATQRNLSAAGRAEAERLGARLRDAAIPIGRVLTSAWCRARETAELLELGPVEPYAPLDSFFAARDRGPEQVRALEAFIRDWSGPGNAVLVTHQVNITGVTGIVPRSGEAVVVARGETGIELLGGRPPPTSA